MFPAAFCCAWLVDGFDSCPLVAASFRGGWFWGRSRGSWTFRARLRRVSLVGLRSRRIGSVNWHSSRAAAGPSWSGSRFSVPVRPSRYPSGKVHCPFHWIGASGLDRGWNRSAPSLVVVLSGLLVSVLLPGLVLRLVRVLLTPLGPGAVLTIARVRLGLRAGRIRAGRVGVL